MREEGNEAPRGDAAPKAFAFDGWSMVPIESSPRQPVAEPLPAEPAPQPLPA